MTGRPRRNPRDPQRTRRILLDAAARAVATRGVGVSFDAVAREAGVSKSGLLHHFGTKDELFAALADDAYERFAAQAQARTEPADLAPGRVMRGYIRAAFADLEAAGDPADYWTVEAQLSVVPAVAQAIRANVASWQQQLTADGLDPDAMRLILFAIAGAEAAASVGALSKEESARLEEQLLRLSRNAGELRTILDPPAEPDRS